MKVSPRLVRWIGQHYERGSAERVLQELEQLPADFGDGQNPERLGAALVLGGSWTDFELRLRAGRMDWRDLLVGAGLGDDDWSQRLESELSDR